ncbi:uncharacterized protein Tco025E_02784 [Trypanosoma conorhini]|uniref:Uncharacterized protein n=1 Tax=Trypanosoma conorhini TaxID=83891 RepID=A0A3R7PQ92_9TRYP|nr:uncharacterized protein Tco025E_02784 [Trypanosoma conorhini]RNF23492.1 hypothetical protein Tco025E_02784 [Trypanosoma conorhini]
MNLEIYVALSELAKLPRGVPHAGKTLMCRAEKVCASRPREFHSGRLFNLSGRLLDGDHKEHCEEDYAHLYFYNDWAFAASFIEEGDIVILKGFTLHDAPCIGEDEAEFPFFITPIKASSTLRVLQNGLQEDVMEVMLRADRLELPCVRVLPKTLRAPFIANDVA